MKAYLDYNATAPLRPEAQAVMQELLPKPLNASSVHASGREAKKHLEAARKVIANAISAFTDEVIFTASGTEGNITALSGFPGKCVLVSAIEHSSVLRHPGEGRDPRLSAGEKPGMDTGLRRYDVIKVKMDGLLDLSALDATLAENKNALVSVMLANNETGVIQPIAEIAAICKKHEALLHCDAVQAFGKIPVDFGALGADMLTLSAHKCGGPVGAAALVMRRKLPFAPLMTGGGQESNRRAGTENIAAIAGFAKAVELFDFVHMKKLRGWLDELENDKIIFGKNAPRLPNTSCIAMPGVSNEVQLMDFDLKGFAISAGSACSSGRIESSHVLAAMGVAETDAKCAIRISGGWATKEEEIKSFTEAWIQTCKRLNSAMPAKAGTRG